MNLEDNPLLKPENFFEGYQKSIDEMKNHPEIIMFDKLTYEVFITEIGKKWLELVTERFLIPSLVNRDTKNYKELVIWADGFKDFARMIKANINSHDQRIKAGQSK
jgi:hypothetical protein